MRLTDAFEDFHDRILLSALSEERINSAWGRLHSFLKEQFALEDTEIFIQGSYANDTAIKPADDDGEYDLDVVCLSATSLEPAAEAIRVLTEALSSDADLRARIDPNESGRPCVRLRYADDPDGFGFHVDIVPASGHDPTGVIEVPMRGHEDWRDSAPFAYTRWCQQQGELFLRAVRFFKRWRDEHGDGSIASIVLQVLSASTLDRAATSDAEAVTSTLANLRAYLGSHPEAPPAIPNPVLPSENLADRWEPDDYRQFCTELEEAVALATSALHSADEEESHRLWAQLFGSDFPSTPAAVNRRSGTAVPPPPPDYPDQRQQAPTDERYG